MRKAYEKKQGVREGYYRDYLQTLRRKAMNVLGGTICCQCGCDVFEALEINHIDGGGSAERRVAHHTQHIRDIANRKIDITKFNVLCRVCNAAHYLMQCGIEGHSVKWAGVV